MLDECAVRAVRKIRRPKIHDGRLLITYSNHNITGSTEANIDLFNFFHFKCKNCGKKRCSTNKNLAKEIKINSLGPPRECILVQTDLANWFAMRFDGCNNN